MILRTLAICTGLVACSAASGVALSYFHGTQESSRVSALSDAPEANTGSFVIPQFAPAMPNVTKPVDQTVKHQVEPLAEPMRTPLPDLPMVDTVPSKKAPVAATPLKHKMQFQPTRITPFDATVRSTRNVIGARPEPALVGRAQLFSGTTVISRAPDYVIGVYR